MSARRRRGRLRKLRGPGKQHDPRLVIARSLADIETKARSRASKRGRYYRGPGGTVIVWQAGKFRIEPGTSESHVRGLAKPPRGLAERVDKAIREGKRNG